MYVYVNIKFLTTIKYKEKSIMRKLFTLAIISASAIMANADYTNEKSHNVVYTIEGCTVYHKDAKSARAHTLHGAKDAKVLMSLERGCEKNHIHKCWMCYALDLNRK